MKRRLFPLLVLVVAWCPAQAATFMRRPEVRETPEGLVIEFIVDGITDVAVAVVDSSGRVVRHLAAGKLGQNAPPPLIRNAYGQRIPWDRTDDAGRPLPPGDYTVRVSLGLKPTFSRMLGEARDATGEILGLAVEPTRGDLFVLGAIGVWHRLPATGGTHNTTVIQVRDRTGAYARTLLPYARALRPAQAGGLRLAEGAWVPRVYEGLAHALLPGLGVPLRQTMVVTSQGRLVFDSGLAPETDGGVSHRLPATGGTQPGLLWLNADGSWPAEGVAGPLLPASGGRGHLHLAASPAGDRLYASGLRRSTGEPEPLHVVYRLRAAGGAQAEGWLGELGKPGDDERHFNDPRGVAVDPAGNVFVADHHNNRICVFEPSGRWLGAIPCQQPDQVFVHPETGHLYVLSLDQTERQMLTRWNEPVTFRKRSLVKLAGWRPGASAGPDAGAGRVLATLDLPRTEAYPVLALDPTANPPLLWYSEGLWRIEDAGDRFTVNRNLLPPAAQALPACGALAADRTRDEVYADTLAPAGPRWTRYEGATGRAQAYPLTSRDAGQLACGPDGLIYGLSPGLLSGGAVTRFDRDGKAVSPAEGPTRRPPLAAETRRLVGLSFTVSAKGDVYLLDSAGDARGKSMQVDVYGADGRRTRAGLVTGLTPGAASVRTDAAGNVYVADCLKRPQEMVPTALGGQVPTLVEGPLGRANWYAALHGSVLKFGPGGGGLAPVAAGLGAHVAVLPTGPQTYRATGLEWAHAGCSPVFAAGPAYWCLSSFDVDGFGRAFVPSALTAEVFVLDTGGNELARLGSYGNRDTPAAAPSVLPFAWPAHVAVSDAACYVADPLNCRIVRVELKYAEEATVTVALK